MKSKEILTQLIDYLEVFEEENEHLSRYTLNDFLSFLQSRIGEKNSPTATRGIGGHKRQTGFQFQENTSTVLARLISLNYRYAKEYTKKALEGSELQTVEEFSFLIVLMTYDHLSKTELILKNVMSKTSGTEVIKRLLKKGLIKQFADKKDKRSQLVAVTSKGLKEMKKVFPKMQMASRIISGKLSLPEQQTLMFLLQKLEAHHNHLFLQHRDEAFEDLLRLNEENPVN